LGDNPEGSGNATSAPGNGAGFAIHSEELVGKELLEGVMYVDHEEIGVGGSVWEFHFDPTVKSSSSKWLLLLP